MLALWLRRRRSTADKRRADVRRAALSLAFALGAVLGARSARADGLFVGVDTGASEPTSGNYRANVHTGLAVNPYLGYMFTDNLGVQGQWHISYQAPDYHTDRSVPGENAQETTLMGWTIGPRISFPITDLFELYTTVQGGAFTGLSGRLSHTGAGISTGAGLNYNLTKALGVGLFGRWNQSYMSPSPNDIGPEQVPEERFGKDIQWMTAGIGVRYSFLREEAPPPAPPPPPPPPPPAPMKKRIVLRAVYFDFDKSNIRPDAAPVLDEAVELLKQEGSVKVIAEGHTDSVGTVQYNLGLSERRAKSVRKYMVDHGLNGNNISTKGFGKAHPVATNETAEGRAQNRRVELRVE